MMRAQTNNLVITNEIKRGAPYVPGTRTSVCAFSLDGMRWELPTDSNRAIPRTVVVGSGYRWRTNVVIDP